MSRLVSIGTSVPAYEHKQEEILRFMQRVYAMDEAGNRKLRFLYQHSGIDQRYSVLPDYSLEPRDWKFYPPTENLEPFPTIEQRMAVFNRHAAPLSVEAIRNCLRGRTVTPTHLITVSCTGMSAPGIDLQVTEMLGLPNTVYRTSVNFMGCYAAIHALKMADAICRSEKKAAVIIVCTELCTLHFQRESNTDSITSALLFGDGSAAALVMNEQDTDDGLRIDNFYSEILPRGKRDMAWELSSTGFQMTLSGYIPELIGEDFGPITERALQSGGITKEQLTHWCIHPGGRRILDAIRLNLGLENRELDDCYAVLKEKGNMSSATILFVLQKIMKKKTGPGKSKLLVAAFGPGLTMETFLASRA